MKLLRLAFKNINSLAGEWSIDFTRPEYRDGIFLIVGDTGSGKTSVLDALSLALYGRTARQEKFSDKVNEVMTRGTGECWAEATFSCESGVYTSRWSQHRAHNRQGGSLQDIEITLTAADGTELADHRGRDAKSRIAGLLGLDFDQFQRTVMLSQGQFDRFLTAKPNERSAILEQATGTEIYARAGCVIHERWKRAKAAAQLALECRNALAALSGDDRAALQTDLDSALAAIPAAQAGLAAAQAECQWHARAAELADRETSLAAEAAALAARDADLAEPRRILAAARTARALDSLHAALETARRTAEAASAEAARRAEAAAAAAKKRDTAAAALRRAAEAQAAAAATLERRLPDIARARQLDSELALATATLATAAKDLRAAETARAEAAARRANLETAIAASRALAGWLGAVLSPDAPGTT
ncbi:MAG: AAA family ATPase, partial [Kiritimatiellae bacterium]|nr:AAA family ATPase [Kiritimatiellia bacterium]